jgi:hypothetical protein
MCRKDKESVRFYSKVTNKMVYDISPYLSALYNVWSSCIQWKNSESQTVKTTFELTDTLSCHFTDKDRIQIITVGYIYFE